MGPRQQQIGDDGGAQADGSVASTSAEGKKKKPPANKILSMPLVNTLAPKKRTYARKAPVNAEPKSKKKRKTQSDDVYQNILPTFAVCKSAFYIHAVPPKILMPFFILFISQELFGETSQSLQLLNAVDDASTSLPIICETDSEWTYGTIPGFGTIEIMDSSDDLNDTENV